MNKVILIGRLTKDPELRFTAGSGMAVSRFTVAVNRQFKKDETDFINCVAFGKTAETISQYLTKGRQIAVIGSIRTGSYDAQDGTKRYTTDVAVESFEFIGNSGQANNQGNTQESTPFDGGWDMESDITPVDDGDMPF
ncbi:MULTISPECIES: single-stranded DNA-binding protein [Clostridium]|uniref:single-stranded DNA-binding protein n=1 Tax=Clostridium TaxID=1485 RepID=UPI002902A0E8|nr:single-stranded DNA-binding protein [Clostridium sp.]MDU2106222.1 single-stranded DNA-binding protein [Clostridium sp.]MDU3355261.1 single-stranded DNA-binding protein [Clostridium sp.]